MAAPVAVQLPGAETPLSAQTVNVSATGVAVAVDGDILTAGSIQLKFLGPDDVAGMDLEGLIRWVRSGRDGRSELGVEFQNVADSVRNQLQMFLYGEIRVIPPLVKSPGSGAFVSP